MKLPVLKITQLTPEAMLPFENKDVCIGLMFFALEETFLLRGETQIIRTGIAVDIPEGYHGTLHLNPIYDYLRLAPGTEIVEDGKDEIIFCVTNISEFSRYIQPHYTLGRLILHKNINYTIETEEGE